MILPVVKLGTLALKTACKPIANRLKKEAVYIPDSANSSSISPRIYGHSTDVAIRPLDEEKAVQAPADLLGELFVFSVAGAAVFFEVQRSSRSEARKEEQRKQELEAMKQRDDDLAQEIELLQQKIEELEQLARGRGFAGLFNPRRTHGTEGVKAKPS
ncbi:hypothetical protein V6N12_012373 [Hibiscus sabdariffa]|uniref:OPA3-like protein n=1 Tax=Hibiscus sabdariffa TaxID=183260 RepID=A0ABR2CIF1_9ROSI